MGSVAGLVRYKNIKTNTTMRKLILLAAIALLATTADAQIFNAHKRALNNAEKRAQDALKGGADFVLDPIEQVPVGKTSRLTIAAQTNWGKDYLLTAALQERIRNECKFPVTVKVYDTGQSEHFALKQGQIPGRNYTTDASVNDGNGHGTHVAGIVAGDEIGLCDLLVDKGLLKHKAVKILSDGGSGSFDWVKNAVAGERSEDLAIIQGGGFVVCNGSFGGGTALVPNVEAELQKSTDAGVVFLFAAGNTGTSGVNYPGNGKYSIACASLDQNLSRSSYSTMGVEVWAAMPGRNINSTYKGNTWASLSGTSMATPFLTAATAVAYSKWGSKIKNLATLRAYLAWCAKDLGTAGRDPETGFGVDLISNILDRDPANTPGLPSDPPPPPPPPVVGGQAITPLPVTLKNEYKILWSNVSASVAITEARPFKTGGRGSRSANRGLANNETLVTFEILAPAVGSSATVSDKLEAAVAKYFTQRGFILPANQDASWAAYWAAYFLEMGLQMDGDWRVTVTRVSFKTPGGQTISQTKDSLKHWPIK